jgi:hypothetical protein
MSTPFDATPRESIAELTRRLACNAEAVCRAYLSNGQRSGRYWHAGDVANTPGRSLYVRLSGDRAGKWVDAATGEHGDLLDLIRLTRDLPTMREAMEDSRRFLDLPTPNPPLRQQYSDRDRIGAAQRLFASARPIQETLAETYLRSRGIAVDATLSALRFHARCYYRDRKGAAAQKRPALLAAITDLDGRITGVHRTWLDAYGRSKAPIACPRRALGHVLGHGVRFGAGGPVLVVGEGLETVLSLKMVMPSLPMLAALSAAHLGAIRLQPDLQRIYIARDRDAAGRWAFARLAKRAEEQGIAAYALDPVRGDFNDDLIADGASALGERVQAQMHREDAVVMQT